MAVAENEKNETHQEIEKLLSQTFKPLHLQVENESHQHAGPAQDSHFKVTIVSADFEGLRSVGRHRAVYASLSGLMPTPIHALALHTFAPQEWASSQVEVPDSPRCRGGA